MESKTDEAKTEDGDSKKEKKSTKKQVSEVNLDSESDASTAEIIREWAGDEDWAEYIAKKSKKKSDAKWKAELEAK